ncbi:gp178 [Sphingomonas phage PAU]|uniref:gp178 n=1 Tax=Sphingomonas phage PAU TaxID=1150991 RepID=UPI00025732FE|nr:gp178 [Sphingomonas phage PAU]AFF28176.1 gp178 [Sphingomonas phage PAU]
MNNQNVQTGKMKAFETLAPRTKEELLQLYSNHMDALEAFDQATNNLENLQFDKKGDLKEAYDYIMGPLLDTVDLPYDVAYIVAKLDDNAKSKFITRNEMTLIQTVVTKSTFRGREDGKKLFKAMTALGKPMQAITELQMEQSNIAQDHVKLESAFNTRVAQVKANRDEIAKVWEELNQDHPAVVRYYAEREAALGKTEEPAKVKTIKKAAK